jgi:autophagy-related protein 2
MQKGTTAFVKSTAMEALRLGARLATGTQVILEQAEGVLGSQFQNPVTAETVQVSMATPDPNEYADDEETREMISKYAEQPMNVREGVQTAYRSLQRNFSSAAQTILAVPMEVYERSGSEVSSTVSESFVTAHVCGRVLSERSFALCLSLC